MPNILQGIAATRSWCGGQFIDDYITNCRLSVTVIEV